MEKMFELIDLFFMAQVMKIQGAAKAFKEEERGASDMVAIIITLATVFNSRLSEIVGQILDNLGIFAGGSQ